jgi:6-hydroxytryprostatin B O-methyltransferase
MGLNGATTGRTGTNSSAAASSPLETLVQDLNMQAKTFAEYLHANGLPEPSFERDAPILNLSPEAPAEIQIAREKLMDAALQIFQLVAGPGEYLQNVITGVRDACLQKNEAALHDLTCNPSITTWRSSAG